MIITDKRDWCSIRSIDPGEVFVFEGEFYMKVIEDGDINAVCLDDGKLAYFEGKEKLLFVGAELIIS
jgi:hypothetical protein